MALNPAEIEQFKTLHRLRVPRVMRAIGWIITVGTTIVVLFLTFTPWVQTTSGFGAVTALNPNDPLHSPPPSPCP